MKKRILPFIMMAFVSLLTLKILLIIEYDDASLDFNLATIIFASNSEHKPTETKPAEGHEAPKEGAEAENPNVTKVPKSQVQPNLLDQPQFSESQIDILNNLAKRRDDLDAYQARLDDKNKVLQATESKIDQKLEELKNLQAQVELVLEEYKKKEDANIKSIVKIYESMKPKDAAKIFEELDMVILLQVVENMKESKVATILALMSPQKAKEVTVRFADYKKLKDSANNI
jgi:flagellar motility protein MotE (MotC chaperone)